MRVHQLDEVGCGALAHGGTLPVGEHGSPAHQACEPVALLGIGDDDVLEGLDVAPRGCMADDVDPAGELETLYGLLLVEAAAGAVASDECLDRGHSYRGVVD